MRQAYYSNICIEIYIYDFPEREREGERERENLLHYMTFTNWLSWDCIQYQTIVKRLTKCPTIASNMRHHGQNMLLISEFSI